MPELPRHKENLWSVYQYVYLEYSKLIDVLFNIIKMTLTDLIKKEMYCSKTNTSTNLY